MKNREENTTMNLTKPNKYAAYDKVRKCIASCATFQQINSCNHLLRNFSIMFEDQAMDRALLVESYDRMSEIANVRLEPINKE